MGQQKGSIELNNVLFGQKTFYSTQQNTTPSASELDDVIDGTKKIDVETSGEKLNVGIDTDGAQQGEVLTADGQGGLEWGPGGGSASWGNIGGTITNQTDLINYISEHGFTPTIVTVAENKTVNGYQVPKFTDEELTTVFNAVVAGKPVVIEDATETMFFTGIHADVISDEIFISFRYFDKMILEYSANNTTSFSIISATAQTVTIAVADWAGGTTCTKSVTGVTSTSIVIVDTSDGNVECTGQGAGTLTFTAMSTPTSAVTVKVVIM